jgi:hypothetical protein
MQRAAPEREGYSMTTSLMTVEFDTATVAVPEVPQPAAPAPGGAGPAAEQAVSLCGCGHDAAAHEHYRAGSDCGACGADRCGRFRAAVRPGLLRRWLQRH